MPSNYSFRRPNIKRRPRINDDDIDNCHCYICERLDWNFSCPSIKNFAVDQITKLEFVSDAEAKGGWRLDWKLDYYYYLDAPNRGEAVLPYDTLDWDPEEEDWEWYDAWMASKTNVFKG